MSSNGMPWVRIDSQAERSPKVRRFINRLGDPDAFIFLVRLWSHVGEWYPDDSPITESVEMLEETLRWRGEPGALIAAMLSEHLLEHEAEGYRVHDWEEHNGAAYRKMEADRERLRQKREERAKAKGRNIIEKPPRKPRERVARQSSDGRATDEQASLVTGRNGTLRNETHTPVVPSQPGASPPAASVCVSSPPAPPEGAPLSAVLQLNGSSALKPVESKPIREPPRLQLITPDKPLRPNAVVTPTGDAALVWAAFAELFGAAKCTRARAALIGGWLEPDGPYTSAQLVRALEGYAGHAWWKSRRHFTTLEAMLESQASIDRGLSLCDDRTNWRDPRARPRAPAPVEPPAPAELPPTSEEHRRAMLAQMRAGLPPELRGVQ